MIQAPRNQGLLRIGVFYDGSYFSHVSNYYLYSHERRARLSIGGLHDFIREEVAKEESTDKRYCQIIDAHYFRGRLSAKLAYEKDSLFRERQFEDVLIREGITMHFLPVNADAHGEISEKGIDVWFALEAFELALHKRFDVIAIITGDGDFVPLVRKLNTLGTRVMLLAWDFESQRDGHTYSTRTSQSLINEVTYSVMMSDEIESRSRKSDPAIARLFVQKPREVPQDDPRDPRDTREPWTPGARPFQQAALVSPAYQSPPAGQGAQPVVERENQTGIVTAVIQDKGYGFIRPDADGDNLFFHVSSLVNCELADLLVGSPVEYNLVATDRGPNAVSIRLKD